MSSNNKDKDKPKAEDKDKDNKETTEEDEIDDPLGIGVDSTTLYIGVGVCVCLLLLCVIGVIFWLRSSGSNDTYSSGDMSSGECCPTPTHYTIEFKYADGVNPYNNFSLPPVLPKPPEYFGTS